MTRYTLHVPDHYNDGTPVGEIVLQDIEWQLGQLAGGFTALLGRGTWIDPVDGQAYHDSQVLYLIDSDDPEVAGKLHRLAERIADALRQEAVYLTHQEIGASLVAPVAA